MRTNWISAHVTTLSITLTLAALLVAPAATAQAAANTKGEGKCQSTLTNAIGKHAAAVTRAMARCEDAVLDGSIAGPCPDPDTEAAIEKSVAKTVKIAAKKCQSDCSISDLPCIGDQFCPPNGLLVEKCTDAGKNIFDLRNMGFPGAFCPSLIGGPVQAPEDFGTCAAELGEIVSADIMANAYGSLDGSPALSADAEDCLATIAKDLAKSAAKLAKTVGKCRAKQLTSDSPTVDPDLCATDDAKTSSKVAKILGKSSDKIGKKCTDAAVLELDLCGNGLGGTADLATAQACLGDVLAELGHSVQDGDTRSYSSLSILNGAYPETAPARCGDGIVNQPPSQFLLIGEECDGTDADDCPGECLPPGDTFECTCGNLLRLRNFTDGPGVDLDTGWTGLSHNAPGTQDTGTISTLTNCDCDAFGVTPTDAATCVGTSSDPVCDVSSETKPRCASRIGDGTSCDEVGNEDGSHTDVDCRACDAFAANAGDYCTGTARRCLGGGSSGQRCNQPSDCPGGSCTGEGACLDGPLAGAGCTQNQNCGVCVGGTNNGGECAIPSNCPGGTCDAHSCASGECLGGANDGDPCITDASCTGGRCAQTTDCLSQCYDADNVAQGPCWRQSDCGPGEQCRGLCDSEDTCILRRNGAPLPLSSGGVSTCIVTPFYSDVTGTRNIVTGENSNDMELRSFTHLANEINSRPCPVCGGYCAAEAGNRSGWICEGSCTGPETECRFGANVGASCVDNADCGGEPCLAVACRFDSDCPSGTCSGDDSPECAGSPCVLDLLCAGGLNDGESCRVESTTRFGTTSNDCPPLPGTNLTGTGLEISWTPLTSETITLEEPAPCDETGYENYDCFCVDGTGNRRSQPNACEAACNDPDPAYYGRPCDHFTQCVGGTEAGASCDEDSDCDGGTCSGDPTTCGAGSTGTCSVSRCAGGSNPGAACSINVQCPGGTCASSSCTVGDLLACSSGADGACYPASCANNGDCDGGATCGDTCPAGRCTPLCGIGGTCSGGERDGFGCILDSDCASGGACVVTDVHDGTCAVGSNYHCDGPGKEFVGCLAADLGTKKNCEFGADGIAGNADDFPGAGTCVRDVRSCFVNDGLAEGGDTLNGQGDSTSVYQVTGYCISSTATDSVNSTAGLPGPGRLRTRSVQVVNRGDTP